MSRGVRPPQPAVSVHPGEVGPPGHSAALNPSVPEGLTLRQWLIILTVSIGALLEIIDVSITNVALLHIQASLGATLAEVGWVVTGYAMASVIMIPLSEWLGELFGQRSYFVFCQIGRAHV